MFRTRLAVAALLLVPTVLAAQGGGGRKKGMGTDTKSADWDAMKKDEAKGLQLSNKDVESTSPIRALIDKRKDLKLSEEVVKQLKDLDAKDKEKNKELFKTLDSLRVETKSLASSASDPDQVHMRLAMSYVGTVVKDIRANYAVTLQAAMPLLDDTQKTMANDVLQKHAKDTDELLREKMGGPGMRGGDAGGARGGRPPSF